MNVLTRYPVVLSGAGLSGGAPASAPLGRELRDAYIGAVIERARPRFPWTLDELRSTTLWRGLGLSEWRLEVLLNLVVSVLGARALEPLGVLLSGNPNHGHELAARLLATPRAPRVHLTVNFDDYVERAYEQVAGEPAESLTLDDATRVSDLIADDWIARPTPAVVHLHGRVSRKPDGSGTAYPGLRVTLDRISQPAPQLMYRLLERAAPFGLLVTGYRGNDPDLWPALRSVLRTTATGAPRIWGMRTSTSFDSDTRQTIADLGFELTVGNSESLLSDALGKRESRAEEPSTFDPNGVAALLEASAAEALLVLAAVCDDLGGPGRELTRKLLLPSPPNAEPSRVKALWWQRLAFNEHELGRPDVAVRYYQRAWTFAERDRGLRASIALGFADASRPLIAGSIPKDRFGHTAKFLLALGTAWLWSRGTGRSDEVSQQALRVTGHTVLRLVDGLAAKKRGRRLRVAMAQGATLALRHSRAGPNGHARMFSEVLLAECAAHLALAADDRDKRLLEAHAWLDHAGAQIVFIGHDLALADLTCAKALLAGVEGREQEAQALFEQADRLYSAQLHPSGAILVRLRRHALDLSLS